MRMFRNKIVKYAPVLLKNPIFVIQKILLNNFWIIV